jgi:hypothetical protein
MAHVIVLFNLKSGTDRAAYEAWARDSDIPTVNALPSVDSFRVLRATGTLAGGTSPFEYVEIIDVNDMARLGEDVARDPMTRIAAEFQAFADNPVFILTEEV